MRKEELNDVSRRSQFKANDDRTVDSVLPIIHKEFCIDIALTKYFYSVVIYMGDNGRVAKPWQQT